MADIQVRSAFVDKVLTGNDGAWGVKTSEPHSRKNESGGYDTTGRTFRTLRGRNVDWSQFQEKDRITFFGREETIEREHDSKKYYDLIVWVDSAAVIRGQEQQNRPAQQQQASTSTDAWATDASPF